LAKADEIRVAYKDRNFIYDIREKYPNATVILNLQTEQELNWKEIEVFNKYMEDKLICCVRDLFQARDCKDRNIKFFFGFPIMSFDELNKVKRIGVCYVRLGGALAFSLDKVTKIGIPVRAVPNIANEWPWPGDDGICGTWIRPEDVEVYDPYISTIEFEGCNLEQERALYNIYAEDRAWPGRVDMIISNIQTDAINHIISPVFGPARIACEQKCQENKHCKFCYQILDFANEEKLRQLKAHLSELKENS
jgi:hypothetical protein